MDLAPRLGCVADAEEVHGAPSLRRFSRGLRFRATLSVFGPCAWLVSIVDAYHGAASPQGRSALGGLDRMGEGC